MNQRASPEARGGAQRSSRQARQPPPCGRIDLARQIRLRGLEAPSPARGFGFVLVVNVRRTCEICPDRGRQICCTRFPHDCGSSDIETDCPIDS
jgi:hypothetical protein